MQRSASAAAGVREQPLNEWPRSGNDGIRLAGPAPPRSGGEWLGASAGALVGSSAAMMALAGQIQRVAPSDATVLIVGESGTGK
jgi:transcriptional regulator with GAF, ATPase, and Fis domain